MTKRGKYRNIHWQLASSDYHPYSSSDIIYYKCIGPGNNNQLFYCYQPNLISVNCNSLQHTMHMVTCNINKYIFVHHLNMSQPNKFLIKILRIIFKFLMA